jgi:hypothetical protein
MSFIARKLISASGGETEPTDPDFNLVTQLYQFDGSNGSQNNTYVDSSSTSKTLTESGNVVQGSFSPFSADEGKWSASFAATNPNIDYLQVASSSDFAFGTGDYTIEAWVWKDSTGQQSIYDGRGGTNTNRILFYVNSANKLANYINADVKGAATTDFPLSQWVHVALVRSGTTGYMFQNGTQVSTWTGDSTDIAAPDTAGLYIGEDTRSSYSYPWDGFISNLRVLKGTALYTGSYTTPTSPLTAITNTKLLTCCSNRHRDKSTSAHVVNSVNSVTNKNGPAIKPFSPFAPSSSYNAANKGGSAHFPTGETGNKIECGTSADFAFGTGAFTIEAWVYVTADTYPYSRMMNIGPYWNDNNSIGLLTDDTDNSNKISLGVYSAVTNARVCVSTNATPRNQWFHVAVSRDGTGDFRLFVNGNLDSTNTSYRTVNVSSGGNQPLTIGGTTDRAVEEPFEGFISNFRVVKGTAVYTSSFTVPTAPVADVTNTKLLANFTNAAMFDQTGKTNINTIGNAQLDTSIKKFGTASAKFDESGDYLVINTSFGIYLGAGDFTIEGFVYFNSSPTDGQGLFVYDSAVMGNRAGYGPALGTYANAPYQGKWHSYYGTQATPGTGTQGNSEATPSATTWIHFAYVRTSGVIKIFIDGSQIGSDIAFTGDYKANGILTIAGYYSTSYLLNGYIDSYRVTLKARYTSNFTAPTEAFLNR